MGPGSARQREADAHRRATSAQQTVRTERARPVSATPGRPPKHVSLPPKYRDPRSGATWSGRGRAPGWIAGTKLERILIQG
ncbi:H-NS family nucleoid-associated regulatory protein [Paraburkholderia sp. CNPSo 3274]|uniref:H-NS family nucleoid-associated regulatory protein n=1 Tax=Paraburkholderia sp. CNPSo 3274 TaxID=2940932 RepID=UPI0035CCDF30